MEDWGFFTFKNVHELLSEQSNFELYNHKNLSLIDDRDQLAFANAFKNDPPCILPFDKEINNWGSGIDIGPHTSKDLVVPQD